MIVMLHSSLRSHIKVWIRKKAHEFDVDQLYRLSLVLSYGTRICMAYYQGVDRAGGETFGRQCMWFRQSLYNKNQTTY